jgi:hypothetical protein
LNGEYVFADYCSGRVWTVDPAASGTRPPTLAAETRITFSSFGEDEAGVVYATDLAAGRLLRLVAPRP